MAGFTVTNVQPDQVQDNAGNLVDVYDITFTLDGRPGQFTKQVSQDGDPVAAALAAIEAEQAQVLGIYGL